MTVRCSMTRSFKINMGQYESAEVSATVSLDDHDLLGPDAVANMSVDEIVAALQGAIVEQLTEMLAPEFVSLAKMSRASDSILFDDAPVQRPARGEERPSNRRAPRRRRSQ